MSLIGGHVVKCRLADRTGQPLGEWGQIYIFITSADQEISGGGSGRHNQKLSDQTQHRTRRSAENPACSSYPLQLVGHIHGDNSPDVSQTLCRWFRKYAGAKYDSSARRRPGRPPKPQNIRDLVVRLAKENTSWGYTKLRCSDRLVCHLSRLEIA